jgi:hypothetical protein
MLKWRIAYARFRVVSTKTIPLVTLLSGTALRIARAFERGKREKGRNSLSAIAVGLFSLVLHHEVTPFYEAVL